MICAYSSTLEQFLSVDPSSVLAALHSAVLADGFGRHWTAQTQAWQEELEVLRDAITQLLALNPAMRSCLLCLEYEIARRGRRIDAVVVTNHVVIVLEFKSVLVALDGAAQWQVREYALDLRDFHAGSAGIPIVPVLVTTTPSGSGTGRPGFSPFGAGVHDVVSCDGSGLAYVLEAIVTATADVATPRIDPLAWRDAPYRPSPNIIEAAERVFAGQEVREISHATAENLTDTVDCIVQTVNEARLASRKVICFLTGVPGAGKTLAGLSAVHDPILRPDGRPTAVFLSGNGPLVKIVRAALVRDLARRHCRTSDSEREVSTFIQNVHAFLGHYAFKAPDDIPSENVVVFDEAQRAWNGEQMRRKKRGTVSEAALMLDVMERCPGWAVIVALVGFGQEIHQGEAGLQEWGVALQNRAEKWSVAASPLVLDHHSDGGAVRLFTHESPEGMVVQKEARLHLATSIRSPRALMISDWVEAVLQGDSDRARGLFQQTLEFPVIHTRDLESARAWLRARADHSPYPGNCGLVASSGGLRLRAYGLEVSSGFRHGFPYEEWFLAKPGDTRSASMLEVAATEFECQGLELDWVGVAWGGDLMFDVTGWRTRRFAGTKWLSVETQVGRRFILNKYRVLLTRARRGMVLWIPPGSATDSTLAAKHFDATAEFLGACGIPHL
jgi:hypothetical protein